MTGLDPVATDGLDPVARGTFLAPFAGFFIPYSDSMTNPLPCPPYLGNGATQIIILHCAGTANPNAKNRTIYSKPNLTIVNAGMVSILFSITFRLLLSACARLPIRQQIDAVSIGLSTWFTNRNHSPSLVTS